MASQQTSENKTSFFKNDRALVCGMLVFYSICILGLIGASIWWLGDRNQKLSISSTATASVKATERAEVTATAVSRATEQAGYEFIDRFDENNYYWDIGSSSDEYSDDRKEVSGGVYTWQVDKVKKSFVSWEDFYRSVFSSNYDVYVDTRITEGKTGDVCSGLLFGLSSSGFDGGGYVFAVCNDATFYLDHHSEKDGWQEIVEERYHPAIRVGDWNRLEVSSRGAGFTLFINNEMVYKTTDHQYAKGDLAVIIDVDEAPAHIEFDNFGYQPR